MNDYVNDGVVGATSVQDRVSSIRPLSYPRSSAFICGSELRVPGCGLRACGFRASPAGSEPPVDVPSVLDAVDLEEDPSAHLGVEGLEVGLGGRQDQESMGHLSRISSRSLP